MHLWKIQKNMQGFWPQMWRLKINSILENHCIIRKSMFLKLNNDT